MSERVSQKLRWFLHFVEHACSVAETCRHFNISRSSFYRWLDRFDPTDLRSLEDRSHEPATVRQAGVSPHAVALIRRYREQYPQMGKERIAELLEQDHRLTLSTSTVGRVIERECLYFGDTPLHWRKRSAGQERRTEQAAVALPEPSAADVAPDGRGACPDASCPLCRFKQFGWTRIKSVALIASVLFNLALAGLIIITALLEGHATSAQPLPPVELPGLEQSSAPTSFLPASLSRIFGIEQVEAATGIYAPINYQGKLTDSGGVAIGDGTYNMRFKLFNSPTGGVPLWTETWDNTVQRVTATGGLFSIALGTHTAMTGSVDFNSDSLYLQVEFDPNNLGTYPEVFLPRRRFASVPYAHNADSLDGLDSRQFIRSDISYTSSGTLTVSPRNAAKIGIDILSTAGSSATGGLRISTQGAPAILFGSGGLNYDTNLYRSTFNTLRTDDSFTAAGTLSGNVLYIAKNARIFGQITNSGGILTKGTLSGELLLVSGASSFSGSSTFKNALTVRGILSGESLRVSAGGAIVQGAISASGSILTKGTLSGENLIVSGVSSFSGASMYKSSLTVRGVMSGQSLRISAGGAIIQGAIAASGSILTKGTLSGENLIVSGVSSFSGSSTFKNNLTVRGILSGQSLRISAGGAIIQGAITASGNIITKRTLSGENLIVSGVSSFSGAALFKSTVTAKGSFSGSLITQNGGGNNYFLGNVGIGTTSPNGRLEVNQSTTSAEGLRITKPTSTVSSSPTVRAYGFSPSYELLNKDGTQNWYLGIDDNDGKKFKIGRGYGTNQGLMSITIDTNDNVGIGTNSPSYPFSVSATNPSNVVSIIQNNGGGTTSHGLDISAGSNSAGGADFAYFQIPNGNVLGSISQNGTTGVLYNTTSDRRLKENIVDSTGGLALLNHIQVRDFNFIADPTKQKTQGFIAQELYQVYPDAVHVGGDDPKTNAWAVDYGRLTPLLVKSIQELDTRTLAVMNASGTVLQARDLLSSSGALVVSGASRFGSGVVITTHATASGENLLTVRSDAHGSGRTVLRVQADGNVFAGGNFSGGGADYAERFLSSTPDLQPGEAVCLDPLKQDMVKRCDRDGDANIMGIISTKPAFVGDKYSGVNADGVNGKNSAVVGLIGQLPVKAIVEGTGSIGVGDALAAAAKPGFLRKAKPGESTVGVALSPLSSGQGTIDVLITRRNQSDLVAKIDDEVASNIASLNIGDKISQMVQSSIANSNIDSSVAQAVQAQLNVLNISDQVNRIIDQRMADGSMTLNAAGSLVTDILSTIGTNSGSAAIDNAVTARLGLARTGSAALISASDLLVQGALTVQRDATVNGTLHAAALNVSGLSVLRGPFTAGPLSVTGSAVQIGAITQSGSLKVIGDVTVQGLATFLGAVEVHGTLTVNSNQAGYAVIPTLATSVTVPFGSGFDTAPVVTASADVPVLFAVSHVTASGFAIRLATPATERTTFSWLALAVREPKVTEDSGGSVPAIPFHIDTQGRPFSLSDTIWNACIHDPNAYDVCRGYHQGTLWFSHPDVVAGGQQVQSFTYDGSTMPPTLILPPEYTPTVVELTSSSSSSPPGSASSSAPASSASSSAGIAPGSGSGSSVSLAPSNVHSKDTSGSGAGIPAVSAKNQPGGRPSPGTNSGAVLNPAGTRGGPVSSEQLPAPRFPSASGAAISLDSGSVLPASR